MCSDEKNVFFGSPLAESQGGGRHFWSTVDIATRKNDTEYDTFSTLDKCI
jgi:hypothetical protein